MAVRKKDSKKVSVQEAKEAFQAGTATDEQLDVCIESAKERAIRLMREYREARAELAKYEREKADRDDARVAKVVNDDKNVRLCSYRIYDRSQGYSKDYYNSYDYKLDSSTGRIFVTRESHFGESVSRPDVEICSVDYLLSKYDVVSEHIEKNRHYGKMDSPLSDENRKLVDSREIRRKSFEYWKNEGYDVADTVLEPKGSAKKDRSSEADFLFGDIVKAAKQAAAEADTTTPGE